MSATDELSPELALAAERAERAAAARAEAGDDDDGEGEGDEEGEPGSPDGGGQDGEPGEPDPELEAAANPEQAFDQKALERELARHEKAMEKVLGEAFPDMHPCPSCDGFGYTPGRIEPLPEMVQDESTVRCEPCRGLGLVKTGSFREGQQERSCSHCAGSGFQTVQQPPAPPPYVAPPPGYAPPPVALAPAPEAPPGYILVPTALPPEQQQPAQPIDTGYPPPAA